ncbi:MAG TPA: hypothetical protein VGG39_24180 [Polyangiaceae bacterium]|jgi:hypothetical protein
MRAAAFPVLASILALAPGCNEGSAGAPAFQASEGGLALDATVGDAAEEASYAVCPDGMDATFGSIYTLMLSTPSSTNGCGTANPNSCHSTTGSSSKNAGNLLDFSLDAGAVYFELLGDGGGHPAANIGDFQNHVLRVVPYDAGASLLYIKLTLDGSLPDDGGVPIYGVGMPYNDPGSVCPAAVQAVADWINAGATFEPSRADAGGDGAADGGPDAESDGGLDAGADAPVDGGAGD